MQKQWKRLSDQKWDEHENTVNFWIEVNGFKNSVDENPFKELSEFVSSLLILPFSNADVERLFSMMGLIKNKLRNRMRTEVLSSLIYIKQGLSISKQCCNSYHIPNKVLSKIGKSQKYKKSAEDCDDIDDIFNNLQLL